MTRREVVVALALTLVVAVAVPSALVLALLGRGGGGGGSGGSSGGGGPAGPVTADGRDDVPLVPVPVVVGEAPPVGEQQVPDGLRVSARARSVQVGAAVTAQGPVVWQAAQVMSVLASSVRDAQGRDLGRGGVTATGRVSFRASAGGTTVQTQDRLLVRPDGVTVQPRSTGFSAAAELGGDGLRLTGDLLLERAPGAPSVRVPGGTAVLEGRPVRVEGDVLRWPSPGPLAVRGPGLVSMAAPGASAVLPGGRRLVAPYLGVAADDLDVRLRTEGRAVVVSGRALRTTQVYTDGSPRLRTTAAVELKTPVLRVDRAADSDQRFTWAPRNTGTADMLMTRIRPVGPEAAWVQLALAPGPEVFGGEDRPAVGGDTRGLGGRRRSCFFCGGARAIRSLLPPGDADSRDITVRPPADVRPGRYVVRLRVEGNFPAVEVRVPVDVV